jgi:hypothetical protein
MLRFLPTALYPAVLLLLSACAGSDINLPTGDCRLPEAGVLYIQPTATAYADPVLTPTAAPPVTLTPTTTPTVTITPTATPLPYCTPTPTPAGQGYATPTPFMRGRGAGEVRNLTLSPDDATIETAAAGRHNAAVAWREGLLLVVATSDGGSDFQARPLGPGEQAALVFSRTDRLHLVYVHDGRMHYRAAAAGIHPAIAPETLIGPGSRPSLALDNRGWAHLLYIDGGMARHRAQQPDGWSLPTVVAPGETVTAAFTSDGALVAAVKQGDTVRIYRRDNQDASWSERATIQTGDTVTGVPQLDSDGDWLYLAFVTEQLDPNGGDWPNFRPEYKPAAPWQNRIHSGANAQQYFTRFAVHSAGVYQQVAVSGNLLTLTAWGQIWSTDEPCTPSDSSCNPTEMRLQVGIDPTGGLNPAGPQVVWSAPANPVDAYQSFSVSAVAQGPLATVYLKSNPLEPRSHNDVYWDSVTLAGGDLVNGGFETGFPEYNGIGELKVADGWHPFYSEDGVGGVADGRYTVQAAWSADGGLSWSESLTVAQNSQGGQRSGKFSGNAYPIIAQGSRPAPSVSFIVLYEEGDPPPWQPNALRYGRPRLVVCELGTDSCSGGTGARLLPNQAVRPTVNLAVAVSPDRQRGLLTWDAWQPGETAKDVYATSLRPQAME